MIRKRIATIFSMIFGYLCIGMSLFITLEITLRKIFTFSLQGAEELGGYILAVLACLGFTVALVGRNHVRIDILHYRLPGGCQAILNWFAQLGKILFALLLAYTSWTMLSDTIEYHSTAPTPWATPLVYPQSAWFAGLLFFALLSGGDFLRATWLLLSGRFDELRMRFQPKAANEELEEEIAEARKR